MSLEPNDSARDGYRDRGDPSEQGQGSSMDRLPEGRSLTLVEGGGPRGGDPLDTPEARMLHGRLLSYFDRELDVQAENRQQMAKDHNAYDCEQWEIEDYAIVSDRGQVPLVFNITQLIINWITGSEKRARKEFKVLPRGKEDGPSAEKKTALMKYLDSANNSSFSVSEAFEDCVKAGLGWLECGVQSDDDEEPIYDQWVDWRDILHDSLATRKDLKDGRYIIRSKWLDLDVAKSIFPRNRWAQLEQAAVTGASMGWQFNRNDDPIDAQETDLADRAGAVNMLAFSRPRVRIIECWYRDPVTVDRHVKGPFKGDIYDPEDPNHVQAERDGKARVMKRPMMRMHVCLMTESDLLWQSPSPYRHNRFPFTPIWCYRRGKNKLPYSVIRVIRDIQFDVNKRASKALAIMSSNKTMMEEGAVDDIDEWQDQAANPNGVLVYKAGKPKPDLNVDRNMAEGHVQMFQMDLAMIQQMTGVNSTALGQKSNAVSGVAKAEDKEGAQLATAGIFDNLMLGSQLHGEKMLSLIEQFMHEEKQFRITNMRGKPEWADINTGLPEDDITRTKADYVLSQQDWRATVRQAQVAELFGLLKEIAPVAPQVVVVMLDMLVEAMDIPQRDELVKRVRQVTGMRDPDAEEPTPEEIQRAQMQQEAQERGIAMEEATIAEKQASATQKAAQALKLKFDGGKVKADTAKVNTDTMMQALQIAMEAMAAAGLMPGSAPATDEVLVQAGFELGPTAAVKEALAAMQRSAPPPQQQMGPPPAPPAQPQPM